MDGPMIAVLVIGSIATVAVAAATMSSYRNRGTRRSRSYMLDKKYYPDDSLEYDPVQQRYPAFPRNSLEIFPEDRPSQFLRNSLRESVYVTPRDSLRDSYRRSSFGGKRKSRKKI